MNPQACRLFLQTLLLLVLAVSLSACGETPRVYKTRSHVFGTVVEISIYDEKEAHAARLSEQVLKEFDRLHHKFHAWEPGMLTALNDSIARGEPFEADAEMVALLKSAAALSAQSDDSFNPAIGHLIRLWGFQQNDPQGRPPAAAEIQRWVRANPRMRDLHFEGTRVSSSNPAVMLDLGGYAKGYALDRAAQMLRADHVKAALVNIGGNIIAIGQPGARAWKVGIRDPRSEGAIAELELHDNEAIGTSGDYQRYFMSGGKRHPHIIDPRSGQTVDLVASVTIITRGGTDAGLRSDGHSKPLFLAGAVGWEAMAQRLGLDEVMLVDTRQQVHMSSGMRKRLQVTAGAAN